MQNTPAHSETPTGADDPRCIPHKLTAPLPVGAECPYPAYTADEQDVWRTLYDRMEALLPGRAANEFLLGLLALDLEKHRIPALADVSRKLSAATNWQIARTPGLLDAHDFFSYLARRIFPCTDYIRARHELDYTPAPDCFHDIFGHTPMIMHPRFANFYQKIGQAALACTDPAVEEGLTRIYWFTVEFGLIQNSGGPRIYGNGIISSSGETRHSLTDKVKKAPYRPETLAAQPYDIWHFQETLFVIESFDQLEAEFSRWARDHRLL
ncbi:MAG: phenylalanine 4-monooxygenase [Lacunisphaera sp.]|jgi:phenylalanine-4-hydroxylase|nr:phenylalanine 4-monooxygenase [Lacunisphaera sp.]